MTFKATLVDALTTRMVDEAAAHVVDSHGLVEHGKVTGVRLTMRFAHPLTASVTDAVMLTAHDVVVDVTLPKIAPPVPPSATVAEGTKP